MIGSKMLEIYFTKEVLLDVVKLEGEILSYEKHRERLPSKELLMRKATRVLDTQKELKIAKENIDKIFKDNGWN